MAGVLIDANTLVDRLAGAIDRARDRVEQSTNLADAAEAAGFLEGLSTAIELVQELIELKEPS